MRIAGRRCLRRPMMIHQPFSTWSEAVNVIVKGVVIYSFCRQLGHHIARGRILLPNERLGKNLTIWDVHLVLDYFIIVAI